MNNTLSLLSSSSFKYFLFHPHLYLRFKLNLLQLQIKKEALFIKKDGKVVDVFIPCGIKDIPILPLTIKSIIKHVMHTIGTIYIVSPHNKEINRIASLYGALWVDEISVSPVPKSSIRYVAQGVDRSGWLYQQFIKLSCTSICKNRYILVQDADTVLIRNQKYVENSLITLNCSNQLPHIPYYETYQKLLHKNILPIYNTTSHSAFIDRTILNSLIKDIEKYSLKQWHKTIIDFINTKEQSFFSDYELYGQYLLQNKKEIISLSHWKNLALSRSQLASLEELEVRYAHTYKSLSFHSYIS